MNVVIPQNDGNDVVDHEKYVKILLGLSNVSPVAKVHFCKMESAETSTSATEEPIIAVEIQNVKIGTEVSNVSNAQLEWNQMLKDLNVSILMNANIMFVIKMLLVQIPLVRIDVNAMMVLLVMATIAAISMNVQQAFFIYLWLFDFAG